MRIPLLIAHSLVHTCFVHGCCLRRGALCASVPGPGKAGQGQSSPRSPDLQGLHWVAVEPRRGAGPRQRKHARGALRVLRTFGSERRSSRPPATYAEIPAGGVRGRPASLLLRALWSSPHPCSSSPCPPLAPLKLPVLSWSSSLSPPELHPLLILPTSLNGLIGPSVIP